MRTIGIIGAGDIGSQVARLGVAHGYDVIISNSRGPETLSALVAELGPRARAATAAEAAKAGDIVVVTMPLKNYRQVPVASFDAVDAGPLKDGWRIQRDTPGYGPRRTAEELRKDLAAAKRYADQ